MRALAHLAKFNGCYERWQKIVKQNGLRWRQTDDNFDFFEKENINDMLDYVRNVVKILPKDQGNTFITATLLGLRADEACKCIALIKQDAKDYYNAEYGVLEHFRFKAQFIRRSKKAYISLVDDDIFKLARESCDSYQAIRSFLKRRKTPMLMKYCRKIYATWLRQNGIEVEFIDLLQGRTPTSVFAKHYNRPNFKVELKKVKRRLDKLKKKLQ